MTSDGCFPEGEDYTTWKSPLIGVRALHPALLPSALWHNPLSPVVSWGACQPAASLPSLLLFRDALGKGSARPVITGYWTWVCGPPASHSLRPGLCRVILRGRGRPVSHHRLLDAGLWSPSLSLPEAWLAQGDGRGRALCLRRRF